MSEERDLLQAGYRYALSLCGRPEDAEDLVQDAWYRLHRNGLGVAGKSLLFAAVRNLFIDGRRRDRVVAFEPLDDAPEPAADGADVHAGVLAACDLAAPLAALRAEEREVLFLHVVEGYTAREVAALTGRPRGTVLSLVHRAKGKLRRALTDGARGVRKARSCPNSKS